MVEKKLPNILYRMNKIVIEPNKCERDKAVRMWIHLTEGSLAYMLFPVTATQINNGAQMTMPIKTCHLTCAFLLMLSWWFAIWYAIESDGGRGIAFAYFRRQLNWLNSVHIIQWRQTVMQNGVCECVCLSRSRAHSLLMSKKRIRWWQSETEISFPSIWIRMCAKWFDIMRVEQSQKQIK